MRAIPRVGPRSRLSHAGHRAVYFEGFGLAAAQPVAVLLILSALVVFVLVDAVERRGLG